mmetsp:Transcript_11029/g.30956  ORF Transcript_11029/g.30956 Transcript_11029/m.30956 type:complete len:275 (-) Transcript_11029:229-1053(-)
MKAGTPILCSARHSRSLLHLEVPLVLVLHLTGLDASDDVIELSCRGTNLLAELILDLHSLAVLLEPRCTADGRHHHGRSHRQHLIEPLHLFHGNIPPLHLVPLVGGNLHQALVGNAGEDAGTFRRHVLLGIVVDPHKVAGGELLHVGLRLGVEVQADGIALLLAQHVGEEVGGVVAGDLDVADATGGGTVKVLDDEGVAGGGEAALVVVPDGDDEDDEGVFVGGLEADARTGTEEERTEVQGAAGSVGGNVGHVVLDDILACLNEDVVGDGGHH